MKKKIKTESSLDEYFKEKFKDPKFVKAYEEVAPLMDVAIGIAMARDQLGLSQSEFAKKLGTTQSVVSRIENGNQNLSVKMLSKMAKILHCELSIRLKPQKKAA